MSLSSIKFARAPLSARASAGLFIGRQYVGMAELASTKDACRVTQLAEVKLDAPLFAGQPVPEASAALAAALGKVAANLKNRYVPVHVSIPDAAVRVTVLELDELPQKRAAQIELARWQLSQDGGALEVCACQPLGQAGGKHLMLALAMEKSWYECVMAALLEAGIVAWSLSTNACRQFNRFHDQITSHGGALVSIAPDSWALWIWDESGRPRYVRARWRSEQNNYVAIVGEIERSILAFVHGAPQRKVARVFVVAGEADSAFTAALNSRLHEPSMILPERDGVTVEAVANPEAMLVAPLLAAALEQ